MENTAERSPEFIAEQAEVLKKGDPFVALEFAIKHNDIAAISELESVVCSDPYGLGIACRFAKEVKGANVSKLEDYTLSLNDSLGVLEFAKEVPGANIAKLEQGLIERNMHDIAGPFAAEVPGANVESLQALVLTSKSPWSICKFAMNVPSADMTQLAQAAADVRIEHAGIYRNGADQTPEKMAAFDLLRMKGKFPDLDLSEVRIHYRDDTEEVYDDCNTGEIPSGDIVIVQSERVVALAWTWPIAVTEECGELHTIETGGYESVQADAQFTPLNMGIAIELAKDYRCELAGWVAEVNGGQTSKQSAKTSRGMGM